MARTIDAIGGCRHPGVAQMHGVCVGVGPEIAGIAGIDEGFACHGTEDFRIGVQVLLTKAKLEFKGK